ncbi:hypothetical protein [Nostoc sp.]
MKYTIVIQWSEEDQCYVVLLPEGERFKAIGKGKSVKISVS